MTGRLRFSFAALCAAGVLDCALYMLTTPATRSEEVSPVMNHAGPAIAFLLKGAAILFFYLTLRVMQRENVPGWLAQGVTIIAATLWLTGAASEFLFGIL